MNRTTRTIADRSATTLSTGLTARFRAAAAVGVFAAAGSAFGAGSVCDPRVPYTMPDLDQVRQAAPGIWGLPNNGSMYCVPTATMNIVKYLTNHGYPGLYPGPGPWLGTTGVYNQMTDAIRLMGMAMNTDPEGGTGGTSATNGVKAWIAASGLTGQIVVNTKGVTSNSAPQLGDIALALLLDRPLTISVGWYNESPPSVLTRNGGHAITVTRLPNFCGPVRQISVRDPGNGGDAFTQQPGTTETYNIQTRNVIVMKDGVPFYVGALERMLGYNAGERRGHIDGLRIYSPKFGIKACNNPVGGLCVSVFMPNLGFTTGAQPTTFNLPGSALLDLDLLASNMRVAAVVAGPTPSVPNQLIIADLAGREPVVVPTPFNPQRVVSGEGEERAYALATGGLLYAVDWRGEGAGSQRVLLPEPGGAVAFDDLNKQVVVLSQDGRRLMRVDSRSGQVVSDQPVPQSVIVGPDPRIAVCPVGEKIWIASGRPEVQALAMDDAGRLVVAASVRVVGPTPEPMSGVAVDDRGHVFASAGGQLVEFAPPAEPDGAWQRVEGSDFETLGDGPLFRIARTRSNEDPEVHDSPEWSRHDLPTAFGDSVPDCPADFNNDGRVDTADITAFLNAWFTDRATGTAAADFNTDGQVNSGDITAFLSAWFDARAGGC